MEAVPLAIAQHRVGVTGALLLVTVKVLDMEEAGRVMALEEVRVMEVAQVTVVEEIRTTPQPPGDMLITMEHRPTRQTQAKPEERKAWHCSR